MSHPFSPVYLDQQIARVLAILPAAGAYDPTPLELYCNTFGRVTLFFTYTAGKIVGAFAFRIDTSPDGAGAVWDRMTLYDPAVVATGFDIQSDIQREAIEYGTLGADPETFVYGPIALGGAAERIRIAAAETGDLVFRGTLEIRAVFGE